MSTRRAPKQHPAVAEAIRIAGSQNALARRLRVSQPTISEWLNLLTAVTPDKVPDIEAETGIPAERLHPAFARLAKLRAARANARAA